MKTKLPAEHTEQVNLITYCQHEGNKYPDLKKIYAIPNGGQRHVVVASKLKAEGVKAGMPDLCLPVSKKGYHGLYIEMKKRSARLKNGELAAGALSEEQKGRIAQLSGDGYLVEVCCGFMEARSCLLQYLGIET